MNAAADLAHLTDPIVAIATAPGRGAVGIVRASGKDLSALIAAVCAKPLTPRVAHYGPILDAQGQALDQGLAIHFPAPNSYTGEEVLELQAHGGPVVLQLILARCLEAGRGIGLRLANPGEFTARAFFNDKLDLAQAEAVADLIDASTEAAARSAGRSLAGAFSKEIAALAERIVHLRMLVEATLDFPEEEIDFLEKAGARAQLADIRARLAAVMARARQGALLREGLRVVLAGAPNVGKSSLLNALAGAELAIVTPIAGTTRDRITETIQIHGVPIHMIDTAGLREASDEVERIGIERSWQAIADADAVLFLHDLSRADDPAAQADDAAIADALARAHAAEPLHVYNKRDLAPDHPLPAGALALSAQTGAGLDALRDALLERAGATHVPDGVFIARTRHVQALARTDEHLLLAQAHADQRDAALDLFAEELRLAHGALGEITGQFTADDLLGEIFGRFCIGK
ncbi:MAG: tRNA uridine-5-carboxymethylaminomethyl(34) synthesis GTPase MnmE [Burkholderiales bacterium]|nr:tRNA uridine-5-carboxymethylaminomethyl(34) synthesis GTPase MnmE [Burkholderiales bacterium]